MLADERNRTPAAPRPHPHAATVVIPRTHAGTFVLPRVTAPPSPFQDPSPAEEQPAAARIPLGKQFALFLVPFVVGFAAGWRGAGQRQMWNDEYATQHAVTLAWGDLLHLLDNIDRVLTLYYVLMHLWVSLVGDSPTMLRLPSVAAMAAAAGFTALVGQRIFNTNAGLVAGLVFALVPAVSRYAQEARPYALSVAAATLATMLLLVALERPVWGRWLLYAVSVGLAAAFHLIAVLVVFPHALLVWFRYQKSDRDVRLWKSLGALALIAAMTMPLAFAGSDQSAAIEWIKADRTAIMQLPRDLFGSYPTAAALAATGLLAVVVLPFARRRRVAVALLAWAILPPVFTYLTFPVLHAFLFRYLLFTLPAWALLAAGAGYGIVRLISRRSWPQLLIAGALLPALILLTLPAQHALREPVMAGEPEFAAAARTIEAGLQPGDGMAFAGTSRPPRLGMAYEMRDSAARPDDIFQVKSPAEVGDFGAQECPATPPCVGKRQRIWLVSTSYSNNPWSEMRSERADTLSGLFKVSKDWRFQRVHVYLLVRKPAK